MKKSTIEDIAKAAGVSIKTVSRVFNREPNVRDTTRDKVLAVAKEMNYRPNVAARGLASNKSYVIVHFHDNPAPDYLERVNQGFHKTCRANGYFAVMEPIAVSKASYAEQVQNYILEFAIDGILLTPPLSDSKALVAFLTESGIPFVRLAPYYKPELTSHTCVDDEQAANMMTKHLINLGHRKIAFISGHPQHGASKARRNGFLQAIKAAQIPPKACPIVQGDFSFQSGYKASEQLMMMEQRPSAIFAANDDMAAGAMVAALKAGLDIPEDISIVGYDGSRIGEIMWPPLTTIRQPIRQLAVRATQLLLEHIRTPNKEISKEHLPVSLVSRGSCAPIKA